jgi:hypothetical protein
MNLLVSYAKIPMSFFNLYRQRRPRRAYTVAIACVMSTIILINLWTVILLVSLVDRDWLTDSAEFGAVDFAEVFLGIAFIELLFVIYVQRKVARDIHFAERVRDAPPLVSICYTMVSVALLAVLAVLTI